MSADLLLPDHPYSGRQFGDALKAMLLERLQLGAESFAELARSMRGAWPLETLGALKSLVVDGLVSQSRFEQLLDSKALVASDPELRDLSGNPDGFLDPHPLHYDWRFSTATVSKLVERLSASGAVSVALLGVPSLYRPLRRSGHSVTLFDVNVNLSTGMTEEEAADFICGSLVKRPLGPLSFDVAVADPPWYLEHYAVFFQRLREFLGPAGKALVSVLPSMTRPEADKDREQIVSRAKTFGFDLEEVLLDYLVYDTPPFEVAALRNQNLILPQWRIADLYVFTKSSEGEDHDGNLQEPLPGETTDIWHTYQFNGCSVAVKQVEANEKDFTFRSCSASGHSVLQTVSRRSEARSRANIWSSFNHALQANRTDYVSYLLSQATSGVDFATALRATKSAYGLSEVSVGELKRLFDVLEECLF